MGWISGVRPAVAGLDFNSDRFVDCNIAVADLPIIEP
jgi:hypothetical protein